MASCSAGVGSRNIYLFVADALRLKTCLSTTHGQACLGPELAANASLVGKGVALGHPLPVVAMGSIPHIYRHASFSLRATPPSLPRQGKTRRFFRMSRLSQFQQKLSRLIKPSCASFALTNR
jgi:hypothetical protein